MEKRTIDTYNFMAKEYDDETVDFWERFPARIFRKFRENIDGRVLDIGSGPGRDGVILRDSGLGVVCLDASEAMVELSKQKGLQSVIADFNNLPFGSGSFDGVWAYTSLVHVPKVELPQALKEAIRVLKDEGVFGLGVIEGKTEGYSNSSGVQLLRYFSFYGKEEIETLLKATGLEVFYFEQFKRKSKNYLNFLARKVI